MASGVKAIGIRKSETGRNCFRSDRYFFFRMVTGRGKAPTPAAATSESADQRLASSIATQLYGYVLSEKLHSLLAKLQLHQTVD